MKHNKLQSMTLASIGILSGALSLLDVGSLGVCTFGENVKIVHPIDRAWTTKDEKYDLSAGAKIISALNFDQSKTNTCQFITDSMKYLSEKQAPNSPQLSIILSDGKGLFVEGREHVRQRLFECQNRNIFTVLVILDSDHASKSSVVDTKKPVFLPDGRVKMSRYLDDFPFQHYLVVRDLEELPGTLSEALKSWFDLITQN